jgi:sugar phosphate isomerase/epimerase
MSTGSEPLARILLKARPTAEQLADRFAPPWPDGLELYLDRADVLTEDDCAQVLRRIRSYRLPAGFSFVVEGPIRGLDNEYFDLGACTEPTKELVRRLGRMASELGAEGVVMHCIMPRFTLTNDDWAQREATFDACMDFVQFYADTLNPLGVVPIIENVPPVLRMREGRYLYTPLGMAPEDVRWFIDRVPGVMTTLDVSHAQLYVNARAMARRGCPLRRRRHRHGPRHRAARPHRAFPGHRDARARQQPRGSHAGRASRHGLGARSADDDRRWVKRAARALTLTGSA